MGAAVLTLGRVEMTERFAIGGMTCGACLRHVEAALRTLPGVSSVRVSLDDATATVRRDPAAAGLAELRRAVAEAGFTLGEATRRPVAGSAPRRTFVGPVLFGLAAAGGLLAVYLGVIALAQGWDHATQQLAADGWFVGALTAGFGTQIALFTYVRALHAGASAAATAASTGTSAAAMLACCAHHLVDVLPVVGMAGAAAFLGAYKTELLWLGIAMNLGGIAYMAVQVRTARRMACQVVPSAPAAQAAPCH